MGHIFLLHKSAVDQQNKSDVQPSGFIHTYKKLFKQSRFEI